MNARIAGISLQKRFIDLSFIDSYTKIGAQLFTLSAGVMEKSNMTPREKVRFLVAFKTADD
jgi:hypothetical protein